MNRMKTEEFFEEKLQEKIREKEAEVVLATSEPEKLTKLKEEIEQLQEAYRSISPKKIVSYEDLK
jgi:hypothetical protein